MGKVTKHCGSCDLTLSVEKFGKNKSRYDGYQGQCNKCRILKQQVYRTEGAGKILVGRSNMKILDKIKRFCKYEDAIDHVTVSEVMFKNIIAEEGFDDCLKISIAVLRNSRYLFDEVWVKPEKNTTLHNPNILLNGKYPRHILNYPTKEFPFGDGATPGDGYGKSLVENMTPACEHKFVNVGFHSVRMICKHCDEEQV